MTPDTSLPQTAGTRRGATVMPDLALALAELDRHRNPDGGWGYAPGKHSRIEPTCWALLALSRASGEPIRIEVLTRWLRREGWLVDVAGAPVNYAFNALAALTLMTHRDGGPDAERIGRALVGVRGLALPQGSAIRQDNSLQAWPWIDGTFSWVEPTSLCLLLVKKLRSRLTDTPADERIAVAERMLTDRACAAGGWNYGGSNVYGQELYPYVPTTALGLLAMQDRHNDAVVSRALGWLQREVQKEPSVQSGALALIALKVLHMEAPPQLRALDAWLATAEERQNILGIALGVYALTRSPLGEVPFTI